MQKELIVLCLIIIAALLGYNLYLRIITEKFNTDIDNPHNCPPLSVPQPPFNSYMSPAKGWCTTNSYSPMPVPDDFQSFDKSPIKCPSDYSRISGKDSIKTEGKSFCRIPQNV
jgi:hypothetical protein